MARRNESGDTGRRGFLHVTARDRARDRRRERVVPNHGLRLRRVGGQDAGCDDSSPSGRKRRAISDSLAR